MCDCMNWLKIYLQVTVCELKTESSEDDEDDKEMLEQSLNNITRLKVLNQIEEQSDCEWYLLEHPEDF